MTEAKQPNPVSQQQSTFKSFAHRIWMTASGLFLIPTVIGFLSNWFWMADLLVNFRVQMSIVGIALLIGAVAVWDSRRRMLVWIGMAILIVLLNGISVASYLIDFESSVESPEVIKIKVMTFNVLSSNQKYDEVIGHIRSESPDILAILEISPKWAKQLEELRTEYSTSKIIPRGDNFGIAFFSRLPVSDIQILYLDDFALPAIRGQIEIENHQVDWVAIHPIPPIGSRESRNRNQSLVSAAETLSRDSSRLLVGDFNMTPWSSHFQKVLKAGNLKDVSAGFGIEPTWYVGPTVMGGLKIDHILSSPDFQVESYSVGPDLGSDHRSVSAILSLPK